MIAPSCPISASELPALDWEVPEDFIAAVFGRRQKGRAALQRNIQQM